MSQSLAYATSLTDEERSRLELVVRRFDRDWLQGRKPEIDEYLPGDSPARRAILVELVHTDLEYRLKDSQPARVEEYLARYPELASDHEAELGLIAAELELRRRREPDLTLDEFRMRFPHHSEELLATKRGARRPHEPRLICPQCGVPLDVPAQANQAKIDCAACAATFRLAPQSSVHLSSVALSRLGKYELIEEVGRGEFGIVYRARDTELRRTVAVKVARTGWVATAAEADWFFREARSAAALAHAHIVPVYDSGREGETCYIVSAFVPGTTLAERLKEGRLAPRDAAELTAQVAGALDHAHREGVVHRDVKPSNILIDPDGQPHLADFGLAKREAGELTLTLDGELLGTPAYMSPEQAKGEGHRVDGRSDVYSLGVVLYEMLTGQRPFQGDRWSIPKQVIEDEPRPPRRLNDRLPSDLETICLKCLEKAPRDRYQSAGFLSDDLQRYLTDRPIQARPAGRAERLLRWCRRNPVVAGSLSAVVVAVVVGFALVTWQWLLARREEARAEANFQIARKSVDDFLVVVSRDALLRRNLPGLKKLRFELLNKALIFYQEFLRQHRNDRKIQADVANAYFNVGLVKRETGSKQEALEAYAHALAIREALRRANPRAPRLLSELVDTYTNMGNLQKVIGRASEAERSYALALDATQKLLSVQSDRAKAQSQLALLYYNLGGLRADSDRPAEAEGYYTQCCDLYRALVAAYPADAEYRYGLATAENSLGTLALRTGRRSDAEKSFVQSLESFRALVANEPNDSSALYGMAGAHMNVGGLQRSTGRLGASEQNLAAAVESFRKLVAMEPYATEYQFNLAVSYLSLGILQLGKSRPPHDANREGGAADVAITTTIGSDQSQNAARIPSEAEQNYLEALEILKKLVATEPNDTKFVGGLVDTYISLGNLQMASGRTSHAEKSYLEARDHMRRLVQYHPDVPAYQSKLAAILDNIGTTWIAFGRVEDAAATIQEAITLERVVFSSTPSILEYRRRLSNHYVNFAEAHRLLRHASKAAAATLERQKFWPNNPDELYNAACEFALCVPLIGQGKGELTRAQKAEQREYSDRAMEALRQAVRAGFKDFAHAKKDPDLAPLRSREDFQALMTDMAFPTDPFVRSPGA